MLEISPAQLASIQQDKRTLLLERIDTWLVDEDRVWAATARAQRHGVLHDIMVYADQSGMSSEREYAVFCRATVLLRADWQSFIEAAPQRQLLLDEKASRNSKLRAYYNRAAAASRSKG